MRALQLKDSKPPPRTLTEEELESALQLLATEARPTPRRGGLWLELLEEVSVALLLFGLPAGLLVVWFEPWLGIGLLVAAGVSFGVLAITPENKLDAEWTRLKMSIGGSESAKVADDVRRKKFGRRADIEITLQLIMIIGGAGWLVLGLLGDGEVQVLALVVAGLGTLWLFAALGFDKLRDIQYYEQVESIRKRFEDHALTVGAGEARISVSEGELTVLARAEDHRTKIAVSESAQQVPFVLENSYAVLLEPEAIETLEGLLADETGDWLDVQTAINSLQEVPRPSSARTVNEAPLTLEVVAGRHTVHYVVDDESRSISVVEVDTKRSHGSRDDG